MWRVHNNQRRYGGFRRIISSDAAKRIAVDGASLQAFCFEHARGHCCYTHESRAPVRCDPRRRQRLLLSEAPVNLTLAGPGDHSDTAATGNGRPRDIKVGLDVSSGRSLTRPRPATWCQPGPGVSGFDRECVSAPDRYGWRPRRLDQTSRPHSERPDPSPPWWPTHQRPEQPDHRFTLGMSFSEGSAI